MLRHSALLLCAALALLAQEPSRIFRITPVRPVPELRAEALAARPPTRRAIRPSALVDLAKLDRRIKLEIRYATTDSFLSTAVYTSARAFLQRPTADALLRAHRDLASQGYGLLIFDAYRPWSITKVFWDATPADKHEFVADPAKGVGPPGHIGYGFGGAPLPVIGEPPPLLFRKRFWWKAQRPIPLPNSEVSTKASSR